MTVAINEQDLGAEGFTLVEILVVLAILALTAAIAAPRFIRGATDPAVSLALDAKEMLQLARLTALSSGKETQVLINLDQRRLISDSPKKSIDISSEISASATVGRDGETTTREGAIHFYPDGSSTGGILRFEVKGRMPSIVKVNWLTGSIVGTRDGNE